MEQMISNLGFPIACVVALGCYFMQKDKTSRDDMNRIIDNLMQDNKIDREIYIESVRKFDDKLGKFDDKLDRFAIALENNNNKLGVIEDDIRNIRDKVGV